MSLHRATAFVYFLILLGAAALNYIPGVTDENGVAIHAVIWVEKDSQKGIVVGKGGGLLKKIGRAARLELKDEYGVPVHLEMWVKVKDNWADSERELLRLGYESP